jgi:2-methylcitrate dehydratase PrpD
MTTTRPAVTEALSRFAAALTFDAIPRDVIERTELLFLDLAGIVVRAQDLDSTQAMKAALRSLGMAGGNAHVLGTAETWSPQAAALINGAAAHSLDFDDTHAPAQLHPGAPVIPAALAAAEMAGATTRELLAGIVAGYEVMTRVSYGLVPLSHSDRGFHLTGTTGVFGAVAAAGNILKLTPEQMAHAFGTALSQTAGSGQFLVNGAWTKRFHVGNASAGGLLAAVLARHGYTGAAQALEGDAGFFKLYSPDPRPDDATQALGERWETLGVAIKPYPCCRAIHAPLDAVLELHKRHEIRIDEIESVRVGMPRKCVDITGAPQERKRAPANIVDCQFSAHLCIAIALKHRHMGWDDYPSALEDAEIRALMQRIDVHVDAACEAEYPRTFPGRIELTMKDGSIWREFVKTPSGEPETMLTLNDLRGKFSLLVQDTLGSQGEAALFDAITHLHDGAPVAQLIRRATPPQRRDR